MKIFVSYTTRDNCIKKKYLLNKYDLLSAYGDVYIDLLHNNSVEKQKRVHNELISSDLFILIKSESINESKWVEWEIKMAQYKDIPIISLEPDFTVNVVNNKLNNLVIKN